MWRRTIAIVALACCTLGGGIPARAAEPVAYYVVDADSGTVLAEKDAHRRWPPASMTKMMTVLLAMERVRAGTAKLDEPIQASAWASRIGGSQVYLREGEVFSLGEMLESIMIASANDAAVAVAEHLAGSTAAFVDQMNARAKTLGLTDTVYQSVHGLPPARGQTADLSSAHDLAVLGRELMRFPEVMRWAGSPSAGFRNDTLQMANTNHLVRTFPGATGLKTGYYREAGFCVTATASRNQLNLIAVVLGLPTKGESFSEAARLMNDAFASYRLVSPVKRGGAVGEVPVAGTAGVAVKAVALQDIRLLVKGADEQTLAVEPRLPRVVQPPVRRGQSLGDVVVRRGDQELGRVAVIADRDVAAAGWLSWLWNRSASAPATP
ncbi:MAG TPA: D-alanyl-D-alanine carboxypeptidase family protein [Candidatus Binatus sp.]|nr:D-alanyl-D-alanine carboxypeptidase family protein [Candidatus Binatus sp.]